MMMLATPEAAQWEGWGTALKPAVEPIVLARKPLSEATVAANVLRWGTGAINVGACRVATDARTDSTMRGRVNGQQCLRPRNCRATTIAATSITCRPLACQRDPRRQRGSGRGVS